jgi:predicted tellurium resistance membrane protein TerC
MVVASEPLARFIRVYPSLKMLALSFLLLVGTVLIADGFSFHVPRGYLYFAIAFSFFVEILNILAGKRNATK